MAAPMNSSNLSNVKQAHAKMANLWEVFNTIAGNQNEQGTGTYREMELTFKLQQAINSLKPGLKRVLTATAALVEHHTGEKPPVPGKQPKGNKKKQKAPAKSPTPAPNHELPDYDEDDEAGETSALSSDEQSDEEEKQLETQPPQSTVKNPKSVPMAVGMSRGMGPMEQIMQLQTEVHPPHLGMGAMDQIMQLQTEADSPYPYPHPPPGKTRVAHQPQWIAPETPTSQPTPGWGSVGKGKGGNKRSYTITPKSQLPSQTKKKGKKTAY